MFPALSSSFLGALYFPSAPPTTASLGLSVSREFAVLSYFSWTPGTLISMIKSFSDTKESPCLNGGMLINLFPPLSNSRIFSAGLLLEIKIVVILDKEELLGRGMKTSGLLSW